MTTQSGMTELLQELREAVDLDGFGCACEPKVQCATCKARSVLYKVLTPIINKYEARGAE